MSETISTTRITEVGRCIRALHEHRRSYSGSHIEYWLSEAIRFLGERKRKMKTEILSIFPANSEERGRFAAAVATFLRGLMVKEGGAA